ncbi:MAG: sulfite exporter TauE/SafE family protein [Oscillospiraceae bacterium]|nr:sulfite exporter TauE/SafE family protein [Oscillospiraceae bacterium]
MIPTFYTYLLVCPLTFLAGLVDAVAGGGGLISLPAYLIAGLPVHNAIATNKMSSSMGTTIATVRYGMSGFIPWKIALFCAVFAMVGSHMGANLALLLSDRVFKIVMLVILPLTAWYVLRGRALDGERESFSAKKTTLIAMGIALAVGVYDGFYGPGTGTFLLLGLTALGHMPLQEANGTTKVINLTSNITALVVFLINGKVLLPLGIVAGLFNVAGNYLGARMFEKGGAKTVKPVMIVVLVIFFIRVITDLI